MRTNNTNGVEAYRGKHHSAFLNATDGERNYESASVFRTTEVGTNMNRRDLPFTQADRKELRRRRKMKPVPVVESGRVEGIGNHDDFGPIRICRKHYQHAKRALVWTVLRDEGEGISIEYAFEKALALAKAMPDGGVRMEIKDDGGDNVYICPVCGAEKHSTAVESDIYTEMFGGIDYNHEEEASVEEDESWLEAMPESSRKEWRDLVAKQEQDDVLWSKAVAGTLCAEDYKGVSTAEGDSTGDVLGNAKDWAGTELANEELWALRKYCWLAAGCRTSTLHLKFDLTDIGDGIMEETILTVKKKGKDRFSNQFAPLWGHTPAMRSGTIKRMLSRKNREYCLKVYEGIRNQNDSKGDAFRGLMDQMDRLPKDWTTYRILRGVETVKTGICQLKLSSSSTWREPIDNFQRCPMSPVVKAPAAPKVIPLNERRPEAYKVPEVEILIGSKYGWETQSVKSCTTRWVKDDPMMWEVLSHR